MLLEDGLRSLVLVPLCPLCRRQSANCEYNCYANLAVKIEMYMRQSQNTSPVKLEHVCQLSHLKSKQPTKFPQLSQTTGLVIRGRGGRGGGNHSFVY